jgi:hypothetical protein
VTGRDLRLREHRRGVAGRTVAVSVPSPIKREREVREWREVAARADAALLRDRRIQSRVQHRDERVGEHGAGARSNPSR